jgi:hypothetical protein
MTSKGFRAGPISAGLVSAAALLGLAFEASAVPPPAAQAIAPPEAPRAVAAGRAAPSRIAQLSEIGMGGLAIEFGMTRLEDVRRSGGGAIGAREGAGAIRWLCYTVESGRRIWIASSDATRGAVTSVTLIAQPGVSGEDACPGLPPRLGPVSDISGISLGDRRADVEALLGPSRSGEWARYEACSTARVNGAPTNRCVAITLRYTNNRVMHISASQTLGPPQRPA